MVKIQDLKKGDFFKRKADAKKVYVRDAYNPSAKSYEAHAFDDISAFISLKKNREVFIDFEF